MLLACLLFVAHSVAQITRTALQGSTPLALSPGAPAGSYPLSGFDTVNLYNGNLNFALPLYKVGGRGEAAYTITLPIEHHWHVEHHRAPLPSTNCGALCDPEAGGSSNIVDLYVPRSDWWGLGSDNPNPNAFGPPPHTPGLLIARSQGHANPACTGSKSIDGRTIGVSYKQTTTVLTFTAPDGTEYELRDNLTGGQPLSTNFSGSPCNPTNTDRGTVFVTTDGTSATFVSATDIQDDPSLPLGTSYPTGTLYLPDGLVYNISNGTVQSIVDRNGNKVQFVYGLEPETSRPLRVAQITDSLGRLVNITYVDTSNPSVAFDTVSYPGFNGAVRTLKIWHARLRDALRATQPGDVATVLPKSSSSLFSEIYAINDANQQAAIACCGAGAPFPDERNDVVNPTIVEAIELPDGRRYRFTYNQYAELARVDLPTGGAYEYDWGSGVPASAQGVKANPNNALDVQLYRRVLKRRVYSDGLNNVLERVESFSAQELVDNTSGRSITLVADETRDGAATLISRSVHYFLEYTSSSLFLAGAQAPFDAGKEFKTEANDFDGVTVLRTVLNDWQEAPASCPITDPIPALNNLPFPLAFSTKLAYNPRNMATTATLENGQSYKTSYQYDCFNNVIETDEFDYGATSPTRITQNTYLTTQTVGGTAVDYANLTNDPSKTLFLRRLPVNTTVNTGSGVSAAVTVRNYDEDGSPITDEPGIVGHGHGFSTSYRTRGNQTSVTRYTDAATLSGPVTSRSAYDIAGNVVSSTDSLGQVTHQIYDSASGAFAFLANVISPVPDRDQSGHSSSATLQIRSTYDFGTGAPVTRTDVNSQVTTLVYNDTLDRPTGTVDPDGGSVSIDYGDAVGDLFSRAVTLMDGSRSLQLYDYVDGLGRHIRSVSFDGTEGTPWAAVDTYYDAAGRKAVVSNPYRVSAPSAIRFPCGQMIACTTTSYDALGRVISVTTGDRATVRTAYQGNSITTTDQAQRTRTISFDALGRLLQVTENPTNVNGDGSPPTTYAYNALDELVAVVQGGQHRYFAYDTLGRLIRRFNPEEGVNTNLPAFADPLTGNNRWSVGFTYDANSNILSKTDARGITVNHAYDGLDREITLSYQDDPANTSSIEHFYDGKGTSATHALGRLTMIKSSDSSGGSYTFDDFTPAGKLLGTTQTVDNVKYPMRYAYDLIGHLISETYPSGRVVTAELDGAGRINSLGSPSNQTPYARSIQYAPHGGIASLQLGNGLWEHTLYDFNRLQIAEVGIGSTPCLTPPCASEIGKFTYDYGTTNNTGNVLRAVSTVPTIQPGQNMVVTQLAQYDGSNRLIAAQEVSGDVSSWQTTAIWQQSFSYDRFGNRTGLTSTGGLPTSGTPAVDPATNRIDVTQASGYAYDAAGNLTQQPIGQIYTYNGDSQLIQTQEGVSVQVFAYDGMGHRVKKTSGSSSTVYVYDAKDQLIAEYTTDTAPKNGTRYVSQDGLGSERLVAGSDASVVARYDFLPFGELIPRGLADRNEIAGYAAQGVIRQLFTGKERDSESGLDFFGARYYSNVLSKWLSPDWSTGPDTVPHASFDDPQSLNLYGYVRNNPLSRTDPDGHDDPAKKAAGAVNAWTSNQLLGVGRVHNGDKSFTEGQAVGDAASLCTGIGEMILGAGGEIGGISLDATGIGAVIGVPANVVSAAVFSHGTAVTLEAAVELGLVDLNTYLALKGIPWRVVEKPYSREPIGRDVDSVLQRNGLPDQPHTNAGAGSDAAPPLKVIHNEPPLQGSASYQEWNKKSTEEIIKSLDPDSAFPLVVYPDGAIANGNTRITILKERGVDVDKLPRVIRQREFEDPLQPKQ